MPRCEIGLGGNQGDVVSTIRRALDVLVESRVNLRSVSRIYRTKAVGENAGGDFINAAASIDTDLSPIALLDRLLAVEAQSGRTREIRWGPRTLDLDLLLYDDDSIETPRLVVPHPACWYRRFVLDPLCDIASERSHPIKCASFRELRNRLLPRPLRVAFAGGDGQMREQLIDRLADDFSNAQFIDWPSRPRGAWGEPAFIFWLQSDDPAGNAGYNSLPSIARLKVAGTGESAEQFVRHVLQSALDEPTVCD